MTGRGGTDEQEGTGDAPGAEPAEPPRGPRPGPARGDAPAPAATSGGVDHARAVLEHVLGAIVEERDSIHIDVGSDGRRRLYQVHVAASDMGRVIGRQGRVAQALRTLARVGGARDGCEAVVDIAD